MSISDSDSDSAPELVQAEDSDEQIPELVEAATENSNLPRTRTNSVTPPQTPMAAKLPPVPLTILTGWLGSGKTTLLKYILSEFGRRGQTVAIINNEVSALGVEEGLLLKDESGTFGEMLELANGCVCCSVKTDFALALETLLRKRRFDYIVVECSGVADPGPLARMFWVDEELESDLYLDGIITVVDGRHVEANMASNRPEAKQVLHQLAYADRIILNKRDIISDAALPELKATLARINTAPVLVTEKCRMPLEQILSIKAFDAEEAEGINAKACNDTAHGHAHGHAHGGPNHRCHEEVDCADLHDRSISSIVITLDEEGFACCPTKLQRWLGDVLWEKVYDNRQVELSRKTPSELCSLATTAASVPLPEDEMEIFRVKGVVAAPGEETKFYLQGVQQLFDIAPGKTEWKKGEARISRFVVIGRRLDELFLQEGFRSCLVPLA